MAPIRYLSVFAVVGLCGAGCAGQAVDGEPAQPQNADRSPAANERDPVGVPPSSTVPSEQLPDDPRFPSLASSDSPEPWATQPLNVNAEPSLIDIYSCYYFGAIDRVFVRQRDKSSSICTQLRLANSFGDEGYGIVPPGLSLPDTWAVEEMLSFFCPSDSGDPWAQRTNVTYYTAAQGTVSLGFDSNGRREYVWLDVSFSDPDPLYLPAVPAELRVESQRMVSNNSLPIAKACNTP